MTAGQAPGGSVRRRVLVAVIGVLVLATSCSSSGSGSGDRAVSVQAGRLPAGTGQLIGADSGFSSNGPARYALPASDHVLLGQTIRPNQVGAGPAEVLRSVDDGLTWRRVALPGPDGTGKRVLWAGGGRAAVMALEAIKPFNGGGTPVVRTSDDAGATWRLAQVPDPNDAGRYIQFGLWWKGRWVFLGNAERGSDPAIYSAIWQSTDGRHLDLDPGILPGASPRFTAAGLTLSGGALVATGSNASGDSQTWRSTDGTHWTLVGPGAHEIGEGALVRGHEVSIDGGQSWKDRSTVPGDGFFLSASRIGVTWWFVQGVDTDEHTGVGRLVRTDDDGAHFRFVSLPARPRLCRTSAAPDEVLDPPRRVGSSLIVLSTCTGTGGTGGPAERPEVQIAISRNDGRTWSSVPVPLAARYGVPVAFTHRRGGAVVLIQDWTVQGAKPTTHLVTLDLG